MPHLEIPAVDDDQGARTFDLLGTAVSVGRAKGNDVVIIDGTLSRKHCELFATGGGSWGVRDLGSGNGVVVNGAKQPGDCGLNDGDRVTLGAVELTYRVDGVDGADGVDGTDAAGGTDEGLDDFGELEFE